MAGAHEHSFRQSKMSHWDLARGYSLSVLDIGYCIVTRLHFKRRRLVVGRRLKTETETLYHNDGMVNDMILYTDRWK